MPMIAPLVLTPGAPRPEHLLVGDSQSMREVEQEILLTAGDDITVLITGESGAGKELVAQSIHRNSKRAGGAIQGDQLRLAHRNAA
jgi:DNA-binding NtrC family response regulator